MTTPPNIANLTGSGAGADDARDLDSNFTAAAAPSAAGDLPEQERESLLTSSTTGDENFRVADGMVSGENPGRGTAEGVTAAGGSTAPELDLHETPAPRGAFNFNPDVSAAGDGRTPGSQRAGAPVRAGAKKKEVEEAEERARVCVEFERLLKEESFSKNQAAAALGKSPSWFSGETSPYMRWKRDGVSGLLRPGTAALRETNKGELARMIEAVPWFIPACRFFYLLTNRTHRDGSLPEAVLRAVSLPALPCGWQKQITERFLKALQTTNEHELTRIPECPSELREAILARHKERRPLVPESIARKIKANGPTVRQYRHPKNAGLDYLSAPGSMFFIHDHRTGERRALQAGDAIEADDATINFPVCVPWTLGGDPCSDKWGVKVGRFQWLVSVSAWSRYITAWAYVMRPRSSYRGEDILSLIKAHCRQHGKPQRAHFEKGSWKSNLVQECLKAAGIHLHTVWSPHQKPYIEGLFNYLWTKLSVHFPGAHVGRFRGEEQAANEVLTRCQRGAEDPRKHFPMLGTAVDVFTDVVRERNESRVESAIGSWVPRERHEAELAAYRPMEAESEWLFSPWVRKWKVQGMLVGGKVPLFEDLSVQFDFSADWMSNYHGATVRVHFDPTEPRCRGMVVLAEDYRGEPAGKILGSAQQINEIAGYARLVMGWGDDPSNAGRLARQRAATALRREVRAIVPGSGAGRAYSVSEERDGVSTVNKIETVKTVSDSAGAENTQLKDRAGLAKGVNERGSSVAKAMEDKEDGSREVRFSQWDYA